MLEGIRMIVLSVSYTHLDVYKRQEGGITLAVLKIVPKLYQGKISEKLKEEISLVTTGEAKYYNRLYKFFQYTDIQCTADINYETRKMYMEDVYKRQALMCFVSGLYSVCTQRMQAYLAGAVCSMII